MGKVRDAKFDTLKGWLILSVVFGHFFSHDATHSAPSEAIANFIYSFHMPLFVFISGYFSNNHKVIQGGVRILETYVVYQLIKGIWLDYSILNLLIKPSPMLWYLFVLFFWRLIYAGMCRLGIKVSVYLIISIVVLSIIAGFVPWIGRKFAFSRFIFFAPYFFLGILAQRTNIIDAIKKRVSSRTALYIMFVTALISCFFVVYPIIRYRVTFAGVVPYPTNMQFVSMIARFFSYIISIIVSVAFLRLFSFENKLFGTIGKDSLKYYIFHGICLLGIETIGVPWSTFLALAYAVVIIVIIFFFNKTKLSDFAISPVSFVINQRKKK